MCRLMRPSCLGIVQGADEKRNEVYINTLSEPYSLQRRNMPEASAEWPAPQESR